MYKNGKNILIIDDEFLALSYMKDMVEDSIKKFPSLADYEVFGVTSYQNFMTTLQENLPNIIFLDVQMPKKNGLEIAKEIRENYKKIGYSSEKLPVIIFATAFENYGYQAFKVNAYDYLLKPISEEMIEDVLNSLVNEYNILNINEEEKITVFSAGIHMNIPISDVLYFTADSKSVSVVTHTKTFTIHETLINLEEKYSNFVKIHRAFLVNPKYISKVSKVEGNMFIQIKDHDKELPVSRRQKQDLEKKLDYKSIE